MSKKKNEIEELSVVDLAVKYRAAMERGDKVLAKQIAEAASSAARAHGALAEARTLAAFTDVA